jgi:hypothetical protein
MACETDSYRAMRGCTACAHQTLRRYKGDDQELLDMFHDALTDVRHFATENPNITILSPMEAMPSMSELIPVHLDR